jgi:hypothetical protein
MLQNTQSCIYERANDHSPLIIHNRTVTPITVYCLYVQLENGQPHLFRRCIGWEQVKALGFGV